MTLQGMNRWRIVLFGITVVDGLGEVFCLCARNQPHLGLQIFLGVVNIGLLGFWCGDLFDAKEAKLRNAEFNRQLEDIRSQLDAYRAAR